MDSPYISGPLGMEKSVRKSHIFANVIMYLFISDSAWLSSLQALKLLL